MTLTRQESPGSSDWQQSGLSEGDIPDGFWLVATFHTHPGHLFSKDGAPSSLPGLSTPDVNFGFRVGIPSIAGIRTKEGEDGVSLFTSADEPALFDSSRDSVFEGESSYFLFSKAPSNGSRMERRSGEFSSGASRGFLNVGRGMKIQYKVDKNRLFEASATGIRLVATDYPRTGEPGVRAFLKDKKFSVR